MPQLPRTFSICLHWLCALATLTACHTQVTVSSTIAATAAPQTLVCRFWHEGDRDWVTMGRGAGEPSEAEMASWGYARRTCSHHVFDQPEPGLVAVYRWWHPGDRDWVTVPDGQIPDATLQSWGYERKTLDFYAYAQAVPGAVPVYRWWHAGDRDWVTVAEGEISGSDLASWGYVTRTGPLYYAQRAAQ